MRSLTTAPKTNKHLRELLGVLLLEFILGVALTTVIEYEPDSSSVLQKIVLLFHILLGGYLLVIAVLQLRRAYQQKILVSESWVGLVSIVIAFGTGSIAAQNGNVWATFAMAVGFIAAFVAYGRGLLIVDKY